MDFNQDKYDIDVRNDDSIKRNQIFFDFLQWTFNLLYGLYLNDKCLLINTIKEDQYRKQSAAEIEKLNREKKERKKGRYIQAFQKKAVLWIILTERVEQQVTPPIKILMQTYHNVVEQAVVKGKIINV